jgi:hypothetical protein
MSTITVSCSSVSCSPCIISSTPLSVCFVRFVVLKTSKKLARRVLLAAPSAHFTLAVLVKPHVNSASSDSFCVAQTRTYIHLDPTTVALDSN